MVQSHFWVARRPAIWGVYQSLRCQIPHVDVMVYGHLLRLAHSSFIVHMGSDGLFKTAKKNCVSLLGRRSASSSVLRPSTTRKTGRSSQGLDCDFFSLKGVLVRWAVIIKFMNEI